MKNKQHLFYWRSLLMTVLICMSACAYAQEEQKNTVRVLSIGNSFSQDAFAYVPFIIEELIPGMTVDWGIMYIGGCSLERHWNNWKGDKSNYEFYRYQTKDGQWKMQKNVSLQDGLKAGNWDIIILQQQSERSRYYETYQPYLDQLLEMIVQKCPGVTLAWLMTQAYGTGYKKLGTMSSDVMWALIVNSSQRVMKETPVQLLIPAGTAIQNARYTVLDRFGKAKHLVYDGYHLHEGMAPLIEGLCTAQVVLKHYGIEVNVEKSNLQITPEWRKMRNTPGPHGEPEEATDEEYSIARRCAKWALESPWHLTVKSE